MSPHFSLDLLALFFLLCHHGFLHSHSQPSPALLLQRHLFPDPTQAALRQKGRAELFIVRLFEVKGFYILMSTK